MAPRLRAFFRAQARRVVERYLLAEGVEAKQVGPGDLFPPVADEDRLLARVVLPYLIDQTIESGALAAQLTGVAPLLRESPELTALMAQMGTRIRGINDETLRAVQNVLRVAAERGYTHYQIANGVEADGYRGIRSVVEETYRGRADTIARTELGTASQRAAHDRYREANVVEVRILDGTECGWRYHDDPDLANGSVRTLREAQEYPLAHPNAVMAGTLIETVGRTQAAYRARWVGPVVDLRTAGGKRLAIGPNHPMLTSRGWIPADALRVGDYVISRTGEAQASRAGVGSHLEHVPSSVEQIFEALRKRGAASRGIPAADDLHGDGRFCEGEVDVVWADSPLLYVTHSAIVEKRRKLALNLARVERQPLARVGAGFERFERVALPASRRMGGIHVGGVFVPASQSDARLAEPVADDAVADAQFARDFQRRFAAGVTLDQVVDLRFHDSFRGHAFDLQTEGQAYFANGILTHNCLRVTVPIVGRR